MNLSQKDLLCIVNSSPVGMLLVDKKGLMQFSNAKAQNIFGYTDTEMNQQSVNMLIPKRHLPKHEKKMLSYFKNPSPRAMGAGRILPAVSKGGIEILVELGLVPVKVEKQNMVLVSIIESSNKVLKIASYYDPLTGLPNRNLFLELSHNLRNLAVRHFTPLTVMFIDLDDFKAVNDNYGHNIGDFVLIKTAEILQQSVRKNDVVGRLGGDEFIVCLYETESIESVEKIAQSIIRKVSEKYEIANCKIEINASVGAVFTTDAAHTSIEEMIKTSDQWMYEAKRSGKGRAICRQADL